MGTAFGFHGLREPEVRSATLNFFFDTRDAKCKQAW